MPVRLARPTVVAAATLAYLVAAACSAGYDAGNAAEGSADARGGHATPVSSTGDTQHISAEVRTELAVARAVTAPYHRVERAEADRYGLPPAPAPLHQCISAEDGHGAMGLHYIAATNLDATLDASLPEVLVYEPTKSGRLRLVALEYVVFAEAWAAEHRDTTPQLFGRDLTYAGEGNRYELPPFFQIHAWIWKHNPHGTFADHNPRVTCSGAANAARE